MTVAEYLALITSEHQGKPNYAATVTLDVSVAARVQELLASLIPKFDVDLAVGDQLDIIGQWVGISRRVTIPIPNVYFQWDSATFANGWDFGIWLAGQTPGSITILPDDVYRTLIKAKIAANRWDGTTTGAYAIWDQVFTTVTILIQDHQDMSYDLAFVGGIVDSLTMAIITGGYLPLKPEAIRVSTYFIPVDSNPLFGWDIENDYIKGWDEGSWAQEITPT